MTSGDAFDAEEYSTDNGQTWLPIGVAEVAAAMNATTGYTVIRDLVTAQWRALRNADIESIGPAADLSEVIPREVNRRINAVVTQELPRVVVARQNPPPVPVPDRDERRR